jgi:hypothetical protein
MMWCYRTVEYMRWSSSWYCLHCCSLFPPVQAALVCAPEGFGHLCKWLHSACATCCCVSVCLACKIHRLLCHRVLCELIMIGWAVLALVWVQGKPGAAPVCTHAGLAALCSRHCVLCRRVSAAGSAAAGCCPVAERNMVLPALILWMVLWGNAEVMRRAADSRMCSVVVCSWCESNQRGFLRCP